MSKHLFGLVVTPHGTAANNRGETPGNITTLQKILWNGEVHTTVSAEAIRWAIRWYWQRQNGKLNRQWDDLASKHSWQDADFLRWTEFIDDDVLGFMSAKAAKEEANDEEQPAEGKKGRKPRARGTCDKRRARLEITRAISLTPFAGDITFNAASVGATPSASSTDPVPYGTEVHATRYQYGFALTPEELSEKRRTLDVVDAITSLSDVAGNHARFLYDFAPESIIFRWTDDFAPRILYGFSLNKDGIPTVPEIIRRVKSGDIGATELVIGGPVVELAEVKSLNGAFVAAGVKAAATEIKNRMSRDLNMK